MIALLRRLGDALALTDGPGMGMTGDRSWGGCPIGAKQAGAEHVHVCTGHPADARPWQHRCSECKFRWAEA